MPDMMFVLSSDGTYLDFTAHREEELAIPPEEIIGKNIREAGFSESVVQMIQESINKALVTDSGQTVEYELKTAVGLCSYETRIVPLKEDQVLATVRNITERKQVEKEVRESRDQLRTLSTHLETVREEERGRLAREIHDGMGQMLTALKMDVAWIRKRLGARQEDIDRKLESMSHLIGDTTGTVQRLSRELRPGLLDDLGLSSTIEWYAGDFEERTGIRCNLSLAAEEITVDRDRSTALYRIFQEIMTNVARHANADRVEISVLRENGRLMLTVSDNGTGITESQISSAESLGIIGMKERVYPWDGDIEITGKRTAERKSR